MTKKAAFFLLLTLITHLLLFTKNANNFRLQQDNYIGYYEALKSGNTASISYFDTRLFPGLPFLIYLFSLVFQSSILSGLMVTIGGLLIIYLVSYNLTKNPLYSFWITVFPPIIFEQTSKISTEVVVIALLLLFYWSFLKGRNALSCLILGYASIIRPISACMFLALILFNLKNKRPMHPINFLIFLIFPILLILFNISSWGLSSVFIQISSYSKLTEQTFGPIQIINDVIRTIERSHWHTLFSGIAYLSFSFFLLHITVNRRKDFFKSGDQVLIRTWIVLSLVFVLLIVQNPFLEDSGRYLSVLFPISLIMNYGYFHSKKTFFYSSFLLIVYSLIK